MAPVVNKQALALHLGVSLPTLSLWILKYGADFPTVERGTNGREWQFDAAAVVEFLRARQAEQAASKAERDEQLAQLRLPLDMPGAEAPPKATSTKDELDAWKLRKLQREEAEACGRLIPVDRLKAWALPAFAELGRAPHNVVRQAGREQGWPDAFVRELERRIGDAQRAAVAKLLAELGVDPAASDPYAAD